MEKNYKKIVIVAFVLVALCLTLGFAALQTNLSISGTATARVNNWDVHFANPTKVGGVTPTTAPAVSNGTTVSYAVALDAPGDYYEFTVDVVNAGSLAAKLSAAPTIGGTSSYLTHTVTYADGTQIKADDTIASGATKTIKVRVEYRTDLTAAQLPTTSSPVTYTVALNYVQA